MALSLRRLRLRRSSPLDEAISALVAITEASRIRAEEARVDLSRRRADLERERVVVERVRAMQATLREGFQASTRRSMWYRAMASRHHRPLPRARTATANRVPRHAPVRRSSVASRDGPDRPRPSDDPLLARHVGLVRVVRGRR
jgi:Domain of unknown function (DUF2382)